MTCPLTGQERTARRAAVSRRENLEFDFGHVKLEMSLRHLRKMTWGQIDN